MKNDVRDFNAVKEACRDVSLIYHLAAQVAVTSSITDPKKDLETNILGTFNVLEAARSSSLKPTIVFTSTNKVYGKMKELTVVENNLRYELGDSCAAVNECQRLNFFSPYGCSKGSADQYVRDYHRIYGLHTVVFRMSCIYGLRQFGTEDQGWVAHFIISALKNRPITIYGDGKQVRDILYVEDLVRAFALAYEKIDVTKGQVYNIGGGQENTISLLELLMLLEEKMRKKLSVDFAEWRQGDQKIYISDVNRAKRDMGWMPKTGVNEGIQKLYDWAQSNIELM
jgi:CDP-paratose 2-epimerase